MRHYEIVIIIHPDQSDQIGVMRDHYTQIVTSRGGIMHRVEDWGRRVMAYTIQKLHKAHYLLMNIECSEEALRELENAFRFSDAVLRHLTIRMGHAETGPSAILREKEKDKERLQQQGGEEKDSPPVEEPVAAPAVKAAPDEVAVAG